MHCITRHSLQDAFFYREYGAEGIRTLDPLVANQVLSQLSYRPETRAKIVAATGSR